MRLKRLFIANILILNDFDFDQLIILEIQKKKNPILIIKKLQ